MQGILGAREETEGCDKMASDTQRLFRTIDAGMRAALHKIELDVEHSSLQDVERKLYGSPLIQDIIDSPEYTQTAIEFLQNPLVINYLRSIRGGELIADKSPITHIFQEITHRVDKLRNIDNAIRAVFDELVQVLYSKKFTLRVFTLLQNFKLERDFTFSPGLDLRINRYTLDDFHPTVADFVERCLNRWDGVQQGSEAFRYIAEFTADHLIEQEIVEEAEHRFQLLHRCLKLCHCNPVSISSIYFIPEKATWHPFFPAKVTRINLVQSIIATGNHTYFLDDLLFSQVASRMHSLDTELKDMSDLYRKRFDMAMLHYIKADFESERVDLGGGIVNIVTAFESLLLPNANTELGHKLAERTALLIGSTYDERVRIFRDMKRVYRARSKLVHGEKLGKMSKELETLNYSARDYLRRCLLAILNIKDDSITQHLELLPFKDRNVNMEVANGGDAAEQAHAADAATVPPQRRFVFFRRVLPTRYREGIAAPLSLAV